MPSYLNINPQKPQTTFAGDEATAINITYIGTGVGVIDAGGVNTIIFTDSESGATLPTDGTTAAGTLDADVATVADIGLLNDVINASSGFKSTIVAALRADDWDDELLDTTPITVNPGEDLDVKWDSADHVAGTTHVKACLGPEADEDRSGAARLSTENGLKRPEPDSASLIEIFDREHRPLSMANLDRLTYSVGDDGTDGTITGQVEVYRSTQAADTLVHTTTIGSDTADADTFSLVATHEFSPPVMSKHGERLVIVFKPVVSAGDAIDQVQLNVEGGHGPAGSPLL